MNNEMKKYSSEEILQLLIDFYNFQTRFDPEVDKGEHLTFDTTISDWISICDLIAPKKLAKVYHDFFNLQTPITELERILTFQEVNKLKDFCEYIAENAYEENIKPIISLGQSCMSAAIFKTLIFNLNKRGVNTDDIKPSSEFIPVFKKYSVELLEEVNKLAPGSLTNFDFKDNWIVRTGGIIIAIFILSIIVIPLIWHFHWSLWIILGIGLTIVMIGKRFKPEKDIIGGYKTIRDLIIGMQEQIYTPSKIDIF
jgi:hypothetical protein